jgi:hypothetical protein
MPGSRREEYSATAGWTLFIVTTSDGVPSSNAGLRLFGVWDIDVLLIGGVVAARHTGAARDTDPAEIGAMMRRPAWVCSSTVPVLIASHAAILFLGVSLSASASQD